MEGRSMRFRSIRVPPLDKIRLELLLGPTMPQGDGSEYPVEMIELAWRAHGGEVMGEWHYPSRPDFRPWAYWAFEVGEEEPDTYEARVLWLAELGLLLGSELEDLANRKTWSDINTGNVHTDEAAVELYERARSRGFGGKSSAVSNWTNHGVSRLRDPAHDRPHRIC